MDDELTPEEQFNAEPAETMVARSLAFGRSPEDIVDDLGRIGWKRSAAEVFVSRVADDLRRFHESPASRQKLIDDAFTQAILGGFILVPSFLVVWIFPIFGIIPFIGGMVLLTRGWTRWRLYRAKARAIDTAVPRDDDWPASPAAEPDETIREKKT